MELGMMIYYTLPFLVLFVAFAGLGVGLKKANVHLRRAMGISWLICFLLVAVLSFGDFSKLGESEALVNMTSFWHWLLGIMQSGWAIAVLIVATIVMLICCSHNPDITWSDPKMRQKARAIFVCSLLFNVIVTMIALAWGLEIIHRAIAFLAL